MVSQKTRIAVVLDTNVLVRTLADPSGKAASTRVYHLWLSRQLQLIVSPEVIEEYLGVLARLGVAQDRVERFARRLAESQTVTNVNLSHYLRLSRDPDDDVMLSTAETGKARYLITHDKDLLEIPPEKLHTFGFKIVTPIEFLQELET
ncbi:MAG: putative toxin-antitoxin system toxin component, PIN family [Anaerolineae bacterium]